MSGSTQFRSADSDRETSGDFCSHAELENRVVGRWIVADRDPGHLQGVDRDPGGDQAKQPRRNLHDPRFGVGGGAPQSDDQDREPQH